MCLSAYADSEDPDQTVHSCSLIRAFAVHCQNHEQRPEQDLAHAPDDVNANILRMLKGTFLLDKAQTSITTKEWTVFISCLIFQVCHSYLYFLISFSLLPYLLFSHCLLLIS